MLSNSTIECWSCLLLVFSLQLPVKVSFFFSGFIFSIKIHLKYMREMVQTLKKFLALAFLFLFLFFILIILSMEFVYDTSLKLLRIMKKFLPVKSANPLSKSLMRLASFLCYLRT